MFEVLSVVAFAAVCYLLLIGIPGFVEKITSEDFKKSYLKYLSKTDLHSYGKSYF